MSGLSRAVEGTRRPALESESHSNIQGFADNARVALSATVYRLAIELSDLDRGVYESLDFRVAQHPSEGLDRVVARILAYALLYEEGLEFGRGLSDAEEPALWTHDLTGQLLHWVDVGTPGADRLHLAAKKTDRVTVVCHKGLEALARETEKKKLHRAKDMRVLLLEPRFVDDVAKRLSRANEWTLVISAGELNLSLGDETLTGSVTEVAVPQ